MRRTALLIASLLAGLPVFAAEIPASLFPVAPAVNAQRGFAVALDGDWLAVGAPQEEEKVEPEQIEVRNAGAVRLFQFEGGLWIEKQRLASPEPQDKGRFGHSVALSGLGLAVGAAGEGKVYIYTRDGSKWYLQETVGEEGEGLGQSVALDGALLASGSVDPDGLGSVHLFDLSGGEWIEVLPSLLGDPAVPDERFGHSMSLRGGTLAVGAPGADDSRGAVYVFQAGEGGLGRVARRTAADGGPGDQLGFAVSVGTGRIAVGAPTADAPGAVNEGALYVFEEGEGWTDGAGGRLAVPGIDGGDRLGYAVSIEDNLLAAGAPFGSAEESGAIYVLIWHELTWNPVDPIEAGQAGLFDLFGSSVAVEGERVAAGSLLLDQGGSSAGSAHTFKCGGSGCTAEAEAAASDQKPEDLLGISLDLDGDTLVLGGIRAPGNGDDGVVYIYRRAGRGWSQEARLDSPPNAQHFGVALAVQGDTLVVGAPTSGTAYVFDRKGEKWIPRETILTPLVPRSGSGFGSSMAIDGKTVVVGALNELATSGAVYVFEEGAVPGVRLLPPMPGLDDDYGFSVAVSGDTIAVGAPNGSAPSVHFFYKTEAGWDWDRERDFIAEAGSGFGSALSMDRGFLLVGAPSQANSGGVAFLYEQEGDRWIPRQTLLGGRLTFFGSALDFHEDAAIIMGYQTSLPEDLLIARNVEARLYSWTRESGLKAQPGVRISLDSVFFGAASVAASRSHFAISLPSLEAADRVLILERTASEEVQP